MTAVQLRVIVAAAVVVLAGGSAQQQGSTWSFDDLPAGRPAPGFVFAGPAGERVAPWLVLRDGSNGVLAQTPHGSPGAQVAVVESASLANLTVSARLRFADGAGAAGIVWRYRNPNNYYLAALDLRAQEIRIYRVTGDNRTRLENEDDLELDPSTWHVLKVQHQGMRMRLWIDGVPVGDARDRTPSEPGAIGVWTAGDAAVWFDALHAEPLTDSTRNSRRD